MPIALVRYNRPDHGPILEIKPLFVDDRNSVNRKWDEIINNARVYRWAEQESFAGTFVNWPRSLYYATGTNSRTFIREMVRQAKLPWCEMTGGTHPGNDTPSQNTLIGFPVTTHRILLPQDPPGDAF